MLSEIDDTKMSELLAPLGRLEPVALREPGDRRHRRVRPVLVAAVVAAALIGTGVAIAAGFGAFDNISAAQHPQTSGDQVSPGAAAFFEKEGCGTGHVEGRKFIPYSCDPGSSRLISTLPNGDRLYVLQASGFAPLCVYLQGAGLSICGGPLDKTHPVLNTAKTSSDGSSLLAGVAMDGVTSVSFTIGGQDVSVPVTDNAWAYEGPGVPTNPDDHTPFLSCLTAHFADGSSVPAYPAEACS